MLKSSYVAKKHRSMLAKETCLVRNRWETWKYEEIEVEKTCLQEFTNCAHLVSYSNLCDWIIKYGSLIDDCRQIRDLIMSRHLGGLNLADFNASPIKVKWGKIIITFSRWKGCKGKKKKTERESRGVALAINAIIFTSCECVLTTQISMLCSVN